MTEAQKRARKKYLDKGKRITLNIYPSEADLIAHLERQGKPITYIKELIRRDMKKGQD